MIVTFTNPYTAKNGDKFTAGANTDLPDDEARNLIEMGRATTEKPTPKKEK